MNGTLLVGVLVATSLLFTVLGLLYARWTARGDPDEFVSARGEVGLAMTVGTLFASAMGPWILFAPPEAATWGGWPAVVGYGLGSALPVLAFIPLGRRMRRVRPEGRTLSEYVYGRYGPGMHGLVLGVILFYLGISLTAQLTGVGVLLRQIAGVPLGISVGLVLGASLLYTAVGGLRTSIFTDVVQGALILPLLAVTVLYASVEFGGLGGALGRLASEAPERARWDYAPGWRGGAALTIAIFGASLFNQGTWQRVWAADSERTLTRGFAVTAPVNGLVVIGLGTFGLAALALGRAEPASTALFNLLDLEAGSLPAVGVVILAVTLVMSSADTILSALTSLVVADFELLTRSLAPEGDERARHGHDRTASAREDGGALRDGEGDRRLRAARWGLVLLVVPIFAVAARGYSVLYLFLVADLVCAAAAYPVFAGLFDPAHGRRSATRGLIGGLVAGGLLFPGPAEMSAFLPAFAAAVGGSVLAALPFRAWGRSF